MSHTIIDSMKKRRSIYQIGAHLPIEKDALEQLVKDAVQYAPSAFNSQTARVVLLYNDEHTWLWNTVLELLRPMLTEKQVAATEKKIASFAAGAATILFFEELAIVAALEEQFPLYKEHFLTWSHHSSGLTQFAVWTALADLNIGASLQHYGTVIEKAVHEHFGFPDTWSLIAQMPIGSIEGAAPKKTFGTIDERVLVRG